MTHHVLEVESLTKSFGPRGGRRHQGGLRAVDDVSFTLTEGGSLAIVGESGSGKTTVTRIIAGLETADSGHAKCCGIVDKNTSGNSRV